MKKYYLVLFLLLFAGPARADIDFNGDASDSIRTEIARYYKTLPAEVQRFHCHVRFESYKQLNKELAYFGGGIVGAFDKPGNIRLAVEEKDIVFNFAHEVGHLAYSNVLTKDQQGKWAKFFDAHKEQMPCKYAKTSDTEGFAECFANTFLPDNGRPEEDDSPWEEVIAEIQSYFKH